MPELLLDLDGLSEAVDVLRGCGLTDGGDRLLCSATRVLLQLQQADGSWPHWELDVSRRGPCGEPLLTEGKPSAYEQVHPTWVARPVFGLRQPLRPTFQAVFQAVSMPSGGGAEPKRS